MTNNAHWRDTPATCDAVANSLQSNVFFMHTLQKPQKEAGAWVPIACCSHHCHTHEDTQRSDPEQMADYGGPASSCNTGSHIYIMSNQLCRPSRHQLHRHDHGFVTVLLMLILRNVGGDAPLRLTSREQGALGTLRHLQSKRSVQQSCLG